MASDDIATVRNLFGMQKVWQRTRVTTSSPSDSSTTTPIGDLLGILSSGAKGPCLAQSSSTPLGRGYTSFVGPNKRPNDWALASIDNTKVARDSDAPLGEIMSKRFKPYEYSPMRFIVLGYGTLHTPFRFLDVF